MPTEIYKLDYVYTIDQMEIEVSPLRIKYLKELMNRFETIKISKNDEEAITVMTECVRIAMQQYYPNFSNSREDVEENFDLATIYKILDAAAGIKINEESSVLEQAQEEQSDSTWDNFDLAKLETEVFLLGIWKNYDELEKSISIAELIAILNSIRELNFEEKKFLAALQGVDLDGESDKNRGQKEWEDMKARVFSGGTTGDSNDILALQGINAQKAGFGIGMGLSYEVVKG
jgi:hypothetical protein